MKFRIKFFLFIFLLSAKVNFAQTGCTDYQATNFDPSAVINNGSCIYANTTLPVSFKCYIDSVELYETSGIVKQADNLWTHVDGGNNSIYRIDSLSDSIFQKVTVSNATNVDWEDITSDSNYFYIGDVGNNDGNRANLRFYKVLKSDITPSSTTVNAGRINFSYSDQVDFSVNHNHNYYDCEAFFYLNDSIHIFTKGWANRWTKHYVLSADTGTHVAQLIDSFNVVSLITSAAIQGDSLVVLLGLNFNGGNNCYVWMFNKFQGSRFFSGNKRRFSIGSTSSAGQAEGICFKDTCKGYITNEQSITPARLREFNLYPFLAPPPPAPVIATSVNAISQNLNACSDSGTTTFTIKNYSTYVGQDLHFTIGGLPSWISATPVSDTIAPGDSSIITLSFRSGTFSSGAYTTNISIPSNDPYHSVKTVVFTLNIGSNPCMDFMFTSDTCNGKINFNSVSVNNPTYYHWNFGDGDTANISNPIHIYPANGNYIVTLIGCNAVGCDTIIRNVQPLITGPKPAACYPVTQSYCCGIGITSFVITGPAGDIFNNNSMDASVGYEDFTCSNTGTLITNYPYALTCTTATTYAEYLKVWIDLNNDGILDSVSEELFSDMDTIAPLHSGTLTIPSHPGNVYGVSLRMRVASDFQQPPQPCLNPQSGQHEDYSVILSLSTVDVNELSNETGLLIYPNPFSHSTRINYTLMQTSDVRLEVFNILGEKVSSLVDSQKQSSGQYQYQFDEQPAGIYFVKLTVNDKTMIEKIVKTN